jgi:hypothetical protein
VLPALSMACATYEFCLCQNGDGSFNDVATYAVCKGSKYEKFDDGRHYCLSNDGDNFNNCSFRKLCQAQGATGDSNCWDRDGS